MTPSFDHEATPLVATIAPRTEEEDTITIKRRTAIKCLAAIAGLMACVAVVGFPVGFPWGSDLSMVALSRTQLTGTQQTEIESATVAGPCDPKAKATDTNSCAYYYSRNTAISLVPDKCPAGDRAEPTPPYWWAECLAKNPKGKCPQGCGTCKKANIAQNKDALCMCAGSTAVCTTECGYPGQFSNKKCPMIPCQEPDLEAAGCIPLDKFHDVYGEPWPNVDHPCSETTDCQAFCAQIIGTNKCKTYHNKPWVTKTICPKNAIMHEDCHNSESHLHPAFNRCKAPASGCPYDTDPSECSSAAGKKKPKIYDKSLENTLKIPDQVCPPLKNRGSEGFPNLLTNLLVPADASITCQRACACNKNKGFGPPDCYYSGEGYPGPTGCCYCNGKNIAYDKSKKDTCGQYLPIFGIGVVPSQEACYEDYVNNPDHPGLLSNFPKKPTYQCVAIGDGSGGGSAPTLPPSPTLPPTFPLGGPW